MKKLLNIFSCVLVFLAVWGCQKDEAEPDEQFLASSDIQLKENGVAKLTYSALTWQLAYYPSEYEFVAGNDDMTSYFSVKCSEEPVSLDQKMDATVEWTESGSVKSASGTFKVVQVTDDCIWLWCSSKEIAVTISKID